MKYPIKRIFSLLLAVLVGLTALGGMAATASAEELEEENTSAYVLSYKGTVEGYAYGGLAYMYTSPFYMKHSYSDPNTESAWTYTYSNEIFQLINTTKLAEGGTGAYASIPVYCTDVDTETSSNANYRRINLEDSTYHASGAAARLRAVILNSFPYIQDMAVITDAANIWLNANGITAIEDLQIGEAMVATQQAIWKITHGDKYTVEDHFVSCGTFDGSNAVYQINAEETETDNTESNIQGLYQYLLSLKGMAPQKDAVSEATFENVVYSAAKEGDGTYTVTVDFAVNTSLSDGDELTLTATCGDEAQTRVLSSGGTYNVTFKGLSDRKEVKLELDGWQLGGDVYLFDALGERSSSQSMIGYDNSRLPVHGEVKASPDRVVNIYKTSSEATGKKPLANIEFELYRVATMEQLETQQVVLSEQPTDEEIAKYQKSENLVAVLKTDVQGFATYNFTDNSQPDGVYMVVERFSDATTGPIEPFFLIVPGTTEDGTGHAYTITVSPKNTTETGPDVYKDVTKLDNNEDSYAVDALHTWIIRGGVPAGIGNAQKYVITDIIDYRLTYQEGSPAVKLFTKAGEELTLTADTHYVLNEGTVVKEFEDVGEKTVSQFTISLTADGMDYVAANLGSGSNIPEIRVYFQAAINANASMGEEIPNQAHLDYTNSAGVDYDSDSDTPKVYTGGINILKTDTAGETLADAVFKIAREATDAECKDNGIVKETLTVGEKTLTVVFEDFYPTRDLSGEKVNEVTTDAEGKAVIYGLPYGTYYIVETKAPAGYNLLTAPIEVSVSASSHLTEADDVKDENGVAIDNTVKVINTKFTLPETGGIGTTIFTVTGLAIIGTAGILLLMNMKKKKY